MLFSPILLANLIFGRLFGETLTPDVAFASNLLGARNTGRRNHEITGRDV